MSFFIRWCLAAGLIFGGAFVGASQASDETTSDLQPILPLARVLFNNPYQFRNYGNGNGANLLSADGKKMLTTSNGFGLWDLTDRQQNQPRPFDTGPVNMYNAAGALSADGKIAAVVPMYYGVDMAVRFFETSSGKLLREIENDEQIAGLAFSSDARQLAVSTRQRIELWDALSGEELRIFSAGQNAQYRHLTFSPDGRMLAALGIEPDTVHVWETVSGKERESIHLGAPPTQTPVRGGKMAARRVIINGNNNVNNILGLAFSTDSRLLAVATNDSAIRLWDVQANRELAPLTGFRGNPLAVVFSMDGKQLLAMDTEGTRLSWRLAAIRRNLNVKLGTLNDDDFAELWNDLAEPDLFRSYRARRYLVADPQRAVKLLESHLQPVPPGDTTRIQHLIKDLSNANAGTRRKAMTELRAKHGEAALGALIERSGQPMNGGAPGMPAGMVIINNGVNNNALMILMQKLQAQYNTPERQRDVRAIRILEETGTPEARQVLTKLSKGAAGVGPTVESQAALERLTAAHKEQTSAPTPEQLWTDLGSDDAAKAFRAVRALIAEPQQAVTLLRKELKPVPVVEEKKIAELMDQLSADDFKVREQATEELGKISEQALPSLKKALDGDVALEARRRIERLVGQALSRSSASLLRGLRAIEVLEHSDAADAKNVLVALSGGAPQAQLTREAKATLQRMVAR